MGNSLEQTPIPTTNPQDAIPIPEPRISPENDADSLDEKTNEEPKDLILFSTDLSKEQLTAVKAYLDSIAKTTSHPPATTILTTLLERIGTIPSDSTAETVQDREIALRRLGKLTSTYEVSFGDNRQRFDQTVTSMVGDIIDSYQLPNILHLEIKRLRGSKNNERLASELVRTRRLVLFGIAKQLGIYPPKTDA